jgi:hypothetical protein
MDMETSPRCLEYPVNNTTGTTARPENNTLTVIDTNNTNTEPVEIAQYDTSFETLCT